MEKVTPQNLIDRGIITHEEWKRLISAYDFENKSWYSAPAEPDEEFDSLFFALYLKVAQALLPEYVTYESGQVLPILHLVDYKELDNLNPSNNEVFEVYFNNLNKVFTLHFVALKDLDRFMKLHHN